MKGLIGLLTYFLKKSCGACQHTPRGSHDTGREPRVNSETRRQSKACLSRDLRPVPAHGKDVRPAKETA